MSGVLYVVSTPIGNLEDITLRAVRILKEVAVIACEDTRVTRTLLTAHGIGTPQVAFHAHSDDAVARRLLARLAEGESVALVSDAGTPLLSDPGAELVAEAVAAGIRVEPVPGASAMLAAMVGAGLPTHRVLFLGFLPRKASEQAEALADLRGAPYTLVLYESPRRLQETLQNLERSLGTRRAVVARELTKRFETFERGTLAELAARFVEAPKGEVVIVVEGARPGEAQEAAEDLETQARALLAQGVRAADAAKALAAAHGVPKKQAYQLLVAIQAEGAE
ncbi:MAG: 16S rRNA (cytidine(1402)-2'-O)-methyltransferase [Myxococcales bacterium]|nr:16S rRNA (cytidine(1402)-2'-O)-methyltransferase [Myxococcales bacterium]MCB9646292.1 16S rRNA (cytidine(1402)-2'-O)-methyltransferase [Deltaproteobacteria bacterium]